MKWIYNSIIIFQLVCCCSLVLCWIFLSTFSLNKFHRWDLASESHTKSFIEEVLRWEIDLDGKHFREKPTNQKDLSQFLISGMRRRSSGEVAAKKVMTSIFSCWGRIALTVALLGWHFMSTLSARSVFQEQPETMNNDKKKHVQSLRCNTMFLLFSDQQERMYWSLALEYVEAKQWEAAARKRLIETKGAIWRKAKRAETAKQNPWWEPNSWQSCLKPMQSPKIKL